MKPGDLVRAQINMHFYSTASRVNKQFPDDFLYKGTTGIIISPPNGTWIRWMVNGKVGWGNWNMMEKIQ